jgi:HD-like signal output (HDOD) protein
MMISATTSDSSERLNFLWLATAISTIKQKLAKAMGKNAKELSFHAERYPICR